MAAVTQDAGIIQYNIAVLSGLDDRLVSVLQSGDIRLLSADYLREPSLRRIGYRQELEELERRGKTSPHLSADEAVSLVRQCDRSAGALTYGWNQFGEPDPTGQRLGLVRQALLQEPHIRGLFWDF
eukprot:116036-Prymnesium_polylepis.1